MLRFAVFAIHSIAPHCSVTNILDATSWGSCGLLYFPVFTIFDTVVCTMCDQCIPAGFQETLRSDLNLLVGNIDNSFLSQTK